MTINCGPLTIREINRQIREADSEEEEIVLVNPGARHNLAVGVLRPCRIRIEGSAGYYCAGLCDGPEVEVEGSAGWGLAENMMSGRVMIHGNAGNGAAASIRGGLVVVGGHAGARAGISMKGGTLLVGGDAGIMTGFMMQKGEIVICGAAGEGLGDSLYEGRIFVAGEIASLGHDAREEELSEEDALWLRRLFTSIPPFLHSSIPPGTTPPPEAFKKVASARQLYHFDRRDFDRWRHAL